ncbi:hypothetical protein [Streptomyces canus]|uniref:hypothetical protein n=1 Tax=Streptomyces canus TaxID=58343 RepID=UPI00074626EB|nr:hypothetical protein [Streptomyces canus]KUN11592.1 hypothetical protein AQI96_17745 [Streptomyces canus]
MQVEDTGQPEKDLSETVCRVCGRDDGSLLWDRHGVPQYVICDCCGIESGLGDDHLSKVRETRGYWVAQGAPWDVPKNRPAGWDVLDQLSAIPAGWR